MRTTRSHVLVRSIDGTQYTRVDHASLAHQPLVK
jgi:hypothetical protein